MKFLIKLFLGLTLLGIISVLLGYFFIYNKPQPNYEKADAEYKMPARDLFREFVQNKAQADSLYTGKIVLIDGQLSRIEQVDSLVLAVFVFGSGMFGEEGVRCTMLPNFKERLILYDTTASIRVKGFCTGYNNDVILEHCSIVE